jgi:hypothetical protein
MEATVVREVVSGDRVFKEMSDGTILVTPARRVPGTQYGDYITVKGALTDDKLAKAKELLTDRVCDMIRAIANERDDFFIIKPSMTGEGHTVGCKFFLPTVDGDVELAGFKELPAVE